VAAPLAITAYLRAYGPATPAHVRSWLARGRVSGKQLKHWFSSLGDVLAKVDVEGEEMYVLAVDADSLLDSKPTRTVRFLPGFDQWVLGPGTNDTHVIPAGRRAQVSRTAGWIAPLVVVGGVVSGTWALSHDRVEIRSFAELGRAPSSALEAEVERLSELIGRPLALELGELS
jgi:hypothetical protein